MPSVPAAAAMIVETCAMLPAQAARRGDFGAVRYLLEHALRAIMSEAAKRFGVGRSTLYRKTRGIR